MSTLLRLKNPGDKRAHTCDARCYNAKGHECKCFCKGANHGHGFEQAVNDIAAHADMYIGQGCTLTKAIEQAIATINAQKGEV